jgi:formylglycine-generating enzyme required for sulfatase activity
MGDDTFGPGAMETISYNYQLSTCEVTNEQFAAFIAAGGYTVRSYWTANGWSWRGTKTEPVYWNDSWWNGLLQPVAVGWYEAVAFCNWLSAREGLTKAYDDAGRASLTATGYRLPTEVEWEYAAAKGGSGQPERLYAWGDIWDSAKAVCSVSPASATKPADVGSTSLEGDTPQGLCDMTGNMAEWCSDNQQADVDVAAGTDRYYFIDDLPTTPFPRLGGTYYSNTTNLLRVPNRQFMEGSYGAGAGLTSFRVSRR